MGENQIVISKYLHYFCYLLMMEVFLMGSGQDIHVIGYLTLRMVNFIVAMFVSLRFLILSGEFPKGILFIVIAFTLPLVLSLLAAIIADSDMSLVFDDIKPILYFYMIFFYYFMSSSEKIIQRAFDILLLAGKIMTVFYLIYILLTDVFHIIPYAVAYQTLDAMNSFMFRGIGSAVYYKGFVFLPIAAVGFFREKQYFWLLLTTLAIYFSFTRGLYLLLLFGILFFYFKTRHIDIVKIIALVLLGLLFYVAAEQFGIFSFEQSFMDNREESDYIRVAIVQQVFEAITWWSAIIGHGFGFGIEARSSYMEISYLDIFHKQGIFGLAVWLLLLVSVIYLGKTASMKYKETANFWVTAVLMVYLQSFFNPYINNPMGLTVILMGLVFCYRFSQDERFADSCPIQC
jgi:hypothetical protein